MQVDETHQAEEQEISQTSMKLWSPKTRLRRKSSESLMSESMSPIVPQSLFGSAEKSPTNTPSSSGGIKRQLSIGSFFSSPSPPGDEKRLKTEPEHKFVPESSPKQQRANMMDTIKALVRSGKLTLDGKPIEWDDSSRSLSEQIHEEMAASKLKPQSGRPKSLLHDRRGTFGGLKSNVRLKGQKVRRHDLPVSTKHGICTDMNLQRPEFVNEDDWFAHFAKQLKMRLKKLKYIWEQRGAWARQMKKDKQSDAQQMRPGRGGAHGTHGATAKKCVTYRKAGAGAKREIPRVYEKVEQWFKSERMHGHTVLQRHLGWKYAEFLDEEVVNLEEKLQKADHHEKVKLKHTLDKAKKQQEAHKNPKRIEKRGHALVQAFGASIRKPNLMTQLAPVEEQVRAEISWNYFDWQVWKMSKAASDDTLAASMFARPSDAQKSIKEAVLEFSDQIPVWVKKPSEKEVYGAWEIKTSQKSVKVMRADVQAALAQKASKKGIRGAAETTEDEKQEKSEQVVPHDGEDEWVIGGRDPQEHQKSHTTTLKEANCDKYRITFEAHQKVLHWWDDSRDPVGVMSKGILIVPGAHAALGNISSSGEWLEDEEFEWMGQIRKHQKGAKVGRTLGSWRKLRDEEPSLFRHFTVMSQPSSNMDSIVMSWSIREQAKESPLSLHQRDCFTGAFSQDVQSHQWVSHQIACSIMSKMTAALQLTDTDFSHHFKAIIRNEVDEVTRSGQQKIRQQDTGGSDIYKMSIRDIAWVIDQACEKLHQKNLEEQWVLRGLRRNGFLTLRPSSDGRMILQDHQNWCKDMPVGSSRIPSAWLQNRLAHVEDGGKTIKEPLWTRMEGAAELADLIEWSYYEKDRVAEYDFGDIDLAVADQEDWVMASRFQLPLDLRRALALRESERDDKSKERKQKLKEKRKEKKLRAEAKHELQEEQKEKIKEDLKSKSRQEVMQAMVPTAKTIKPSQAIKKKVKQMKKQKHAALSILKKKKKQLQKEQKEKAQMKAVKGMQEEQKQEKNEKQEVSAPIAKSTAKDISKHKTSEKPLPSKPLEKSTAAKKKPKEKDAATPLEEHEKPEGTFRVIREGVMPKDLYGRQGPIMGAGKDQFQILFDKDKATKKTKMAWVAKDLVMQVDPSWKYWNWPQLSLSRTLKQQIMELIGVFNGALEIEAIPIWDAIEVVQEKKIPPGGLEMQTMHVGIEVLQWAYNGKHLGPCNGCKVIPGHFPIQILLQHAAGVDEHNLEAALKLEMKNKSLKYLVPICNGHHWTLLVIDQKLQAIRYYDSLRKQGPLHEKCLATSEIFLGYLMEKGIVHADGFKDHPGLMRCNEVEQPPGSNMCGHYVLSWIEEEIVSMACGPAACGHPHDAANEWQVRLSKLTQGISQEVEKIKKDVIERNEKLVAFGNKALAERKRQAELGQKRLAEGHELTALMKEAIEQLEDNNRSDCKQHDGFNVSVTHARIKIHELPDQYKMDMIKIEQRNIKICGKCRWVHMFCIGIHDLLHAGGPMAAMSVIQPNAKDTG